MGTARRLAWIGAGYGLAIAGGVAVAAVRELLMPQDIAQGSPGMVAFGSMILFIFVAGLLGLVPTFFLLRLWREKAPRTLLAVLLIAAATGPLAWLAMTGLAAATPQGGPSTLQNLPEAIQGLAGTLIVFGAVPRIVLGPVLLLVEGVTLLMMRTPAARVLLAAAMLLDIVPLCWFALHMARGMMRS